MPARAISLWLMAAMFAGSTGKHIAKAGRLGELESDTSSPCGLLVHTEGHRPLADGGPALGPENCAANA